MEFLVKKQTFLSLECLGLGIAGALVTKKKKKKTRCGSRTSEKTAENERSIIRFLSLHKITDKQNGYTKKT